MLFSRSCSLGSLSHDLARSLVRFFAILPAVACYCTLLNSLARFWPVLRALACCLSIVLAFVRTCRLPGTLFGDFALSWASLLALARCCRSCLRSVGLFRLELLSRALGRSRSVLGALACSCLLLLALVRFLLIFFVLNRSRTLLEALARSCSLSLALACSCSFFVDLLSFESLSNAFERCRSCLFAFFLSFFVSFFLSFLLAFCLSWSLLLALCRSFSYGSPLHAFVRSRTLLHALVNCLLIFLAFNRSGTLLGIIAECWALLLVLARSCLLLVVLPCFGSLSHVPERSRSISGSFARSCSLVFVLARLLQAFSFEAALARSRTLWLDLRRSCPLLFALGRSCSLLLLPGGPACLAACAYAQPYPCAPDCAFQRMQVINKQMMMPERTQEASTWGSKSGVAQWLACWAHNPKVPGSKPGSAILRRLAALRRRAS